MTLIYMAIHAIKTPPARLDKKLLKVNLLLVITRI